MLHLGGLADALAKRIIRALMMSIDQRDHIATLVERYR